jgi:protein-tyrosine phosphatase
MTGSSSAASTRILEWEGCLNVRDVGGLPATGGRRTRSGALVRSDVLSRLTPAGREALLAHGVRTIVDVRSPSETARDADSYALSKPTVDGDERWPAYLNLPFADGHEERAWQYIKAAYEVASSREELNRIDLDSHAKGIAAIVGAIADAPPGGVLVHCHAGKDRTGLVVALLLALVGVADAEIADDYALTALNLEPLIVDWLHQMSEDPAEHARLRALADPRREAMLDTLAYLRRRHGTAERYLLAAGVEPEQIDRLRWRLLDGG